MEKQAAQMSGAFGMGLSHTPGWGHSVGMSRMQARQIYLVLGFFAAGILVSLPFIFTTVVWPPDAWDHKVTYLYDRTTQDGHRIIVWQAWNGHYVSTPPPDKYGYLTTVSSMPPDGDPANYQMSNSDRKIWSIECILDEDKGQFTLTHPAKGPFTFLWREPAFWKGPPDTFEER